MLFSTVSRESCESRAARDWKQRSEIGLIWHRSWEDDICGMFEFSCKLSKLIFWQNLLTVVAAQGYKLAWMRPVSAVVQKSFDLRGFWQTGPNVASENSVKAISFGLLFSLTQDPPLCFCVPLSRLSPWQFITCYSDYHFNYRVWLL